MADPQLTGGIRVLQIWKGPSGLPEDRYINTFAFSSDVAETTIGKVAAIDKVQAFYRNAYGGQTVGQFLATQSIIEAASETRAYSMADPPNEREPTIVPWDTSGGAFGSATSLPSEVAVCASFYAGTNNPRNRGRLYIGPLNTGAIAVVNDVARVNNAFMQVLLAAMLDLGSVGAEQPAWCVLAKNNTDGSRILKRVTDCWVDNSFDTQRRRGEAATTRLTAHVV